MDTMHTGYRCMVGYSKNVVRRGFVNDPIEEVDGGDVWRETRPEGERIETRIFEAEQNRDKKGVWGPKTQ